MELYGVEAEVERYLQLLDKATHLTPQLPLPQRFLLYVFEERLPLFLADDVSFPLRVVE